jgi:hypothetical protein
MIEALGGISMDDLRSPEESRIDYVCLNGLLAVEVKTLDEDASERLGNLTDELSKRPDWPIFLGSWPMDSVIKNMDDPEVVRRQMLNRMGRAVVSHLKKANKQLAAHETAVARKNLVRVMLLINEDHEVYGPQAVGYVLKHELFRTKAGGFAYQHVDAVIYMSERHATIIDRQLAFPLMTVEGPPMIEACWKASVTDRFMSGWADWNGHPLYSSEPESTKFNTIDHIPDQAPRHERWRTDYRRNPYFRHLSQEQLREKWDEVMVINLFRFRHGSPVKVDDRLVGANMERFTHLMEEMARRGIPATVFQPSADRYVAAAGRLNISENGLAWLADSTAHRTE